MLIHRGKIEIFLKKSQHKYIIQTQITFSKFKLVIRSTRSNIEANNTILDLLNKKIAMLCLVIGQRKITNNALISS